MGIKKKVGRPTKYSKELVDLICERLSNGETLRSICADAAMPSHATIFRWELEHKEFCELSSRARERGTHVLADECIAIADDPMLEPHDKRVRIDTRLRLIGKWNAKRYGEKVGVELGANDELSGFLGLIRRGNNAEHPE